MKYLWLLVALPLIAAIIWWKIPQELTAPQGDSMRLTSPVFVHNDKIPARYTCMGEDISPPLQISAVPLEAKTLVLIMDDPDSPTGVWTHWLLWNIDPTTKMIEEDKVPFEAVQGTNTFGKQNYGGPCPGSGQHRYVFKLYALDVKLDLSPSANQRQLEAAIKDHVLVKGELMGRYSKEFSE